MIANRQDLADYCLRQLGGGVVNIEVSTDQLEDAVEDAITYFQEFHPDGIEEAYVPHKITATVLTVASSTGFSVGDLITGGTSGTRTRITAVDTNKLTITRMVPTPYVATETITNGISTTTITSLVTGTIDKHYIDLPDPVIAVQKVVNLSSILSSTDYMFSAQYQVMLSEIQNLAAGSTKYLYSTMSYLAHLDFILRKEKTFRFNRRTNKVFLDINWDTEAPVGDYLVIQVYKALDDDMYSEMLNDIWLKRYTTALIKKTWGANLKKYQGMQLPGGLTYNGQQIYNEAIQEIKDLEAEVITLMSPPGFLVG